MHTSSTSSLLAAASLIVALGMFTGPVRAEEPVGGSEARSTADYGNKLTPSERSGIRSEEDVSPDDGKASVPDPADQDVIPDAADPEKGDTTVTAPSGGNLPGDVPTKGGKSTESEADVILEESKKNLRVGKAEYEKCLSQWDPQSQMTKEQWAESCRTTLQYFPEGD
jgi:hypothetical protein